MVMIKAKTINRGQKAEQLARSAFELFAEKGFASVNLEQIASRAGVTKGSLYWHYENKQELILAACEYYYRQWHEQAQKEIASVPDPLEQLRRVLAFGVNSCLMDSRNRLFTTGVFTLLQTDEDVREGWKKFYDSVREVYIGLVSKMPFAQKLSKAAVRRNVDLMLEAMEGLKFRAGFEPQIAKPVECRSMVEGYLRILCHE